MGSLKYYACPLAVVFYCFLYRNQIYPLFLPALKFLMRRRRGGLKVEEFNRSAKLLNCYYCYVSRD